MIPYTDLRNPEAATLGSELNDLQQRVAKFRGTHFPDQTTLAASRKMRDEIEELVAEEERAANGSKLAELRRDMEAADVLITFLGWCEAKNVSIIDVAIDAGFKMSINEHREWILNADGTASHVKEAT